MVQLNWFLYRLLGRMHRATGEGHKQSWSQCGEDLIARYIFDSLCIAAPIYLDVGAHHPTRLNNTQLFYSQGARGINVEPDPGLIDAFRTQRPRDVNLNVGIADTEGERDFFVMSARTLNTFSEEDARSAEREGKVRIERVVRLPVTTINALLDTHCSSGLDFLSLDVEGLDLTILRSLDLNRFRPKVVCVETITYSEHRAGKKIKAIADLMHDNGYFSYADTYINTLFVDRTAWQGA